MEETPGQTGPHQEGTSTLRPRARLMRTLGDELISSEVVAISELVKNAYDADATRVLIRFVPPLEPGRGAIEIIDDGHGMTLETIQGAFLEPATRFRQRQSRSEEFGRIVTGEKGIGRFAVSRLADGLELVSRRPSATSETRVIFDWRLFDREDAYLDEIDVVWESTAPRDIAPGGPVEALWPDGAPSADRLERGTLLRMQDLRAAWDHQQLETLRTSLARLVSPFLFEQQQGGQDAFSIFISAPEPLTDLSGAVEPPETLRNPHYLLRGHVASDGSYELSMKLRGEAAFVERTGRIKIRGRAPTCGPLDIELRVWDRDAASMRELGQQIGSSSRSVRADLDRVAGINVYRDGFRVLPYGEPGNDWLNLDSRRVQNPTLRLSNNQFLGYVRVGKDSNPELRDQTNREGLIRNEAYEDLHSTLREIIAHLETARYDVRRRETKETEPARGLFAGFDLKLLQNHIAEKYPADQVLQALLGKTELAIERDVEHAQEVIARYRRLATLGQLIDKVLHDGRAPLAKIGDEAVLGSRSLVRREAECEDLLVEVSERLAKISKQHDVLATVFRRIEPFGGRRRGRPANLVLEEVIADSFGVLESDINRLRVDVALPTTKTPVSVDPAELQEVIVNLLANSLYWLSLTPPEKRAISVQVGSDDGGVHIVFSDSGPGVDEEARALIFDPYFSKKEDGVGLGLSIAGEIVHEYYDGDLRLLDEGPLPGATFLVTLKKRI